MDELSQEERDLLESYERGEWSSVRDLDSQKAKYQKIARHTVEKKKKINIRISERDLDAIKLKALEEGIPYQTLIASILHKYASGKLTEKVWCC